MPISTTCPSCQALFRLPEELAGRKVQCQKCASQFVVPAGTGDALAAGARVLGAEDHLDPDVESQTSQAAPTHPDDIPVTPRFVTDAEAIQEDAADRPDPSRPRRGERRPRRDAPPKRSSAMLPIMLTLLGLGLFACLAGSVFTAIWFLGAQPRQMAAVQRQQQFKMQRNGVKNGPAQLDGGALRQQNLTPTIELKLGPDGIVSNHNALTLQDGLNPDQKRHKHYAIHLEAGKKYQIDLQSQAFDAWLCLIDEAGTLVAENDDINPTVILDSRIIYKAPRTGIYKIEATFCPNPPPKNIELGDFTLIVRELKD